MSPRYVHALAAYRRALEQRNRLLKDVRWGQADAASLDAWGAQIVEHGSRLIERRRAFWTSSPPTPPRSTGVLRAARKPS